MMRLRKITITAVRERTVVVNLGHSVGRVCPKCLAGNQMVTATMAANISKHSLRTICRWVEAEQVHYLEDPDGLFICLSSMPRLELQA